MSTQRLVELDKQVDAAEDNGIQARWEFGRELLKERVGELLPRGRLTEVCLATGKSRTEIKYRMLFAEAYPTKQKLVNAVDQFRSWHAIVNDALAHPPAPSEAPAFPTGTFGVILADPPWHYDFSRSPTRAIENQYPTMPLDAIKDLRDKNGLSIRDKAAADCALFLWATSPKLHESLDVMDAWGFDYVTNLVWVKDKWGMGYWARQQHELLLVGRRGDPILPAPEDRPSSVITAPRTEHSEKPNQVYTLIESMFPTATKIDVFARASRSGWTAWGNELVLEPSEA